MFARRISATLLVFIFSASFARAESDTANNLQFPRGFILGASTAAYQIEGSPTADGKGENVWDHFIKEDPSRIFNNSNADIACDSYRLYKTDVKILKDLGFDAYRFSISWARILPSGFSDSVNKAGIAHYSDLIDELIANDIEPIVTLDHWDHPQSIEDLGGWTNADIVYWFADYARVLFRTLGLKVKKWVTMNEPESKCQSGYSIGVHAPGKKIHGIAEYLCGHNSLKAHAYVYRMYEQEFKSSQNGEIGIVFNMAHYYPKDPKNDKVAAEIGFQFTNGWLVNPIYSVDGDYPTIVKYLVDKNSEIQGYETSRLPTFSSDWINYIKGSADFLGINHYTSWLVTSGQTGEIPSFLNDRGLVRSRDPSWNETVSSWLNVVPQGFGDLLRKIDLEYNHVPIYVMENGVSDTGENSDLSRVQYYHDYVREMLIAINRDRVNVKGYFVWSLLDNFEWDQGYSQRFGIVGVDFDDPKRKRTLKKSALWWKSVLESRQLEPVEQSKEEEEENEKVENKTEEYEKVENKTKECEKVEYKPKEYEEVENKTEEYEKVETTTEENEKVESTTEEVARVENA